MKLLLEYLITFFSQFATVQYIPEFSNLRRKNRLYIYTEGMCKILTLKQITVDDTVKTKVLRFFG
jgi:hypothetical protein